MTARGETHRSAPPAQRGARLAAPVLLAVALSLSCPSHAAPDMFSVEDVARVEAERRQAQARLDALRQKGAALSREVATVEADLLAAAADVRQREEAVSAAEAQLAALGQSHAALLAQLTRDRVALEQLLGALMALSARSPPALAASPDDAASAIRAAMLMADIAPMLQARADALNLEVAKLGAATDALKAQRDALAVAMGTLQARQAEISALAAEKRLAAAALDAEARQAVADTQALARQAGSLRELLDQIERAAPRRPGLKPPESRPAPKSAAAAGPPRLSAPSLKPAEPGAKSSARSSAKSGAKPPPARPEAAAKPSASDALLVRPTLPVVGRLVRRFREETHPGAAYAARASAQIVAPLDSRVEYAGLFRSYGQILILDVGESTLLVLAGLDEVHAQPGQYVIAGEPVGRLADRKTPPPELYVEVRQNGRPVDPARWFQQGRKPRG